MGYWDPVTAGVDWCEPNYQYSHHIAEWYNTISNLPALFLCLAGAYRGLKVVHDHGHSTQPVAVAIGYFGIFIVYAGSFAFHATLTYWGQILDEFPMIWATLWLHYMLTGEDSKPAAARVGALIAVLVPTLMVLTHPSPMPLRFAYASLVFSLTVRSFYLAWSQHLLWNSKLLQTGLLFYGTGVILWLSEEQVCHLVQPYFFHLHAWWHVFTGIGTFLWLQFACLRLLTDRGVPHDIESLTGVPFVVVGKGAKRAKRL